MSKTVVVAGASTGIGFATSVALAKAGYDVFAGVRSKAAGEPLRKVSAASRGKITPITLSSPWRSPMRPPLAATPTSRTRPGRVINMSSMAGKLGAPFVGAKHAVEGQSELLRRELMVFGIDVIIIGPGAVVTAI